MADGPSYRRADAPCLFDPLDDVPAERARLRVVVRDADLVDLQLETDVSERGNHLAPRVFPAPAGDAGVRHRIDTGRRVVRPALDEIVEARAFLRLGEHIVRGLPGIFLRAG